MTDVVIVDVPHESGTQAEEGQTDYIELTEHPNPIGSRFWNEPF